MREINSIILSYMMLVVALCQPAISGYKARVANSAVRSSAATFTIAETDTWYAVDGFFLADALGFQAAGEGLAIDGGTDIRITQGAGGTFYLEAFLQFEKDSSATLSNIEFCFWLNGACQNADTYESISGVGTSYIISGGINRRLYLTDRLQVRVKNRTNTDNLKIRVAGLTVNRIH